MLATALALLLAAPACDLPPLAGDRPFRPGEVLTYQAGLAGLEGAGRATLTVGEPREDGAVPVSVEASHGTLVGHVSYAARSLLGGRTLRPIRFHDEQAGTGGRRSTDAHLAASPNAVRVEWTFDGRAGMNAYVRGPGLLDFAAALPYLRAADPAPGQPFCFDLVGATAFWHVEGRAAAAPETVTTPAGTFRALRLTGQAVRAGRDAYRAPLTLWLALDAARTPVAAEIGSPVGTVRARLTGVTPGRQAALQSTL